MRDKYWIVNDGIKHDAKEFFSQLWEETKEDLAKQQEQQEAPSES